MGGVLMNDRRSRGEQLRLLAVRFRGGLDDNRLAAMLEDVDRWKIETVDLAEGVQRVIATQDTNTFPQFATLLKHCQAAAADRHAAARERAEPGFEHRRPPTSDEIDQCEKLRALARRGVFYCDTCQDFVQAERGVNGRGWDPCHYRENRALWAAGTDRRMMRDVLHRSWEQFNKEPAPPLELDLVEGFNGLGDVVADLPF